MRASGRRSAAVATLVFGSGLCALVYQVTWLRELRLVFGASTPASAAVLAVFMGGLGFGGLLLGRRAERAAEPLAFYGRLERWVAVTAGISPLSILAARHAYLAAGGSAALGTMGSAAVRLALTALVLGVPTFLMGGTLPAVGRAVTAAVDPGRRSLGLIYGCNTLGAVAGAALTTFLLLETIGQRKSLWIAALVNLLISAAALRLSRRWSATPASPAGDAPPAGDVTSGAAAVDAAATAAPPRAAVAPLAVVLVAAALVGFAFFLMELVWYRLMAPLFGGTTYTFGTILLLALAGIGAGGLLYGAVARWRLPSLAAFAATCALEALLLIVPLALAHRLALLASILRALSATGFGGLVLGWLVVGGLVVLPASLVAGYQFPLLVALLGSGRREIAAQIGLVAACNTAGAIAGSLAGGFGLLPLLGAPGSWRFATLLLVALALVAAAAGGGSRAPLLRALAAAAALGAALVCLLPGPGALWRHGEIGSSRSPITATTPNELRERVLLEESVLVWEEDGRESGVAVRAVNGLSFSINGKTDGNARLDASTQVMSPLVGAMLHPGPRTALVIGLGTGSSAGWLATVPTMQRVDVVELEPAVVRVARDCAPVNQAVLANPRVRLHLGDGREFLLTHDRPWDLIVSEPSNPYLAGIASLFTTEYYRAAAQRLRPGGVFVQWLQAYRVDAAVVASVYASLVEVFPYVETWATNGADLLLVASATPLRHDLERQRRLVASEPYRRALADGWGVAGIEGFYAGFVAAPAFARRMAASGEPQNVDDRPVIEFALSRDLTGGSFSIAELQRLVPPAERSPPGLALDWQQVRTARALRDLATGGGPPASVGPFGQGRWLVGQGAAGPAAGAGEQPLVGLLLAGEQLAERGDERAEAVAAALLAERPVEAHALRARSLLRRGRREEALAEVEQALVGYRHDPWPWPVLMSRTLGLAMELAGDPAAARRLLAATAEPFAVRMLELDRRSLRLSLAGVAGGDACIAVFHEVEPHPLWNESALRQRAACYARAGDALTDRAHDDLVRFLADQPPSVLDELRRAAAAEGQ
ncbi:MAG TPA: fused MFS/spermidine synthase [Thermoanaerobaculia bacterium]|jgi:spermidine synthase|nr:fused MFS/spermidine synthase [Thermoanaerobaculia bacterium]